MANPEALTQAVMDFEIKPGAEGVAGLGPESDRTTDGVIVGWGPPEETDPDLRRRIQMAEFNSRLEAKKTRKPRLLTKKQRFQAEQRAVDDLMKKRMGPTWGRR